MKLLEYLLLAAVGFAIIFAQESNDGAVDNYILYDETIEVIKNCTNENLDSNVYPNATLRLKTALINATNYLLEAEAIIKNGFSKAKKVVAADGEAAKKLLQKTILDAQITVFKDATPLVLVFGEALALSNEGSRQGLASASKSSQIAGLSALNTLAAAENLLLQGIGAGGNASLAILDAGQLAVNTGFATAYRNLQASARQSGKALINAKNNPMQEPAENPDCESAEGDSEASNAIADINEDSEKSLQRGANADIVKNLSNVLKCGVIRVAEILNKAINEANNLTAPAEKDPFTTQITYFKLVDLVEERLNNIATKGYLAFGEAGIKSGIESNSQFEAAVSTLATGQVEIVMALHSAKDLVSITTGHPGDSPALTLAATAKIGSFIKLSLIQALVKSAKLALSVL